MIYVVKFMVLGGMMLIDNLEILLKVMDEYKNL